MTATPNRPPVLTSGRSGQTQSASQKETVGALALSPGGKIVLSNTGSIVRIFGNGASDTAFGVGGKYLLTDEANGKPYPYQAISSLAVAGDGKILFSGIDGNGLSDFSGLVFGRLTASGQPDASFGTNGRTYVNPIPDSRNNPIDAKLMPDGKLVALAVSFDVVAGNWGSRTKSVVLVRLNSDGRKDPSFGSDGVVLDYTAANLMPSRIVAQADGKVVVTAREWVEGMETSNFILLRYNADGSRDQSFGSDGMVRTAFGAGMSEPLDIVIQSDGKIVVAGKANAENGTEYYAQGFALARYHPDGTLDTSFSGDGKLAQVVPPSSAWMASYGGQVAKAIHIADDGGITLVGEISRMLPDHEWERAMFTLRLHPDGSVDTRYGQQGLALHDIPGELSVVAGIAADANGDMLLAVNVDPEGLRSWRGLLVRIDSNGAVDTGFGEAATGAAGNATDHYHGGTATILNPALSVDDAEIRTLGGNNYGGTSLTLERHGGAHPDDQFGAAGAVVFAGGRAMVGGYDIGAVTNTGGRLRVDFGAAATQAAVTKLMQSITYSHAGKYADGGQVQIDWTFNDGNRGAQGTGGAMSAATTTQVTLRSAEVPYWIDALLDRQHAGQTAAALRETLNSLLGEQAAVKLAFSVNSGAAEFGADEQAFLRAVFGQLAASVDVAAANAGLPLTFHNSPNQAEGKSSTQGLDADGADVFLNFGAALAGSIANRHSITVLHGILHVLGLKNAAEPGATGAVLRPGDDRSDLSLMSDGAPLALLPAGVREPGVLDIAALHYLFGPNPQARKGDDVYVLNSSGNNFIWDGAGVDTISAESSSLDLTLHLAPGHWDYLGQQASHIAAAGQVTINYGTVIENAIGGSGHDFIVGTSTSNVLKGGAGNDRLSGLGGGDTLDGGAGIDTVLYANARAAYVIEPTASGYRITPLDGGAADALTGVEALQFADQQVRLNKAPVGGLTVLGQAALYQTLTVLNEVTDGDGIAAVQYQWYADGQAIALATAATLTLSREQVGKAVTVGISYTDGGGTPESVLSQATAVVAFANAAPTGTVRIGGTARQYETLNAVHDLADLDGMGPIAYQWMADGRPLAGETGASILLTLAHAGKAISVQASYRDGTGTPEAVRSSETSPVVGVNYPGRLVTSGGLWAGATLGAAAEDFELVNLANVAYRWVASTDGANWETVLTGTGMTYASLPVDARLAARIVGVVADFVDEAGGRSSPTAMWAPAEGARLVGAQANDCLTGGVGNDTLWGRMGDDVLDGGAGRDTAVYGQSYLEYVIRSGALGMTVAAVSGQDGVDSLRNIERLHFADRDIAFDLDGNAGQAYRLYQAAFGRAPDPTGLGYWIKALDQGTPLRTVAEGFTASAEFVKLFGASPDSRTLVGALFKNILGRAPDQGGLDYWSNVLDTKAATLSEVLVGFSESGENQAALVGSIGNGIVFVPYAG